MTSATSPTGAAHQWPSPVSPRSHESGEEGEKQKMEEKLLVHLLQRKQKQKKSSESYMLSRFSQSMINQSCLHLSSHCLFCFIIQFPIDFVGGDFWIQLSRALLSLLSKEEGIH